jgi:predicted HTH transcriptional regulator
MKKNAHHADQVLSLISRREQVQIEFKRRAPSSFKMAKELAAMANTAGGSILVGVDDDGSIAGVADPQKEKEAVIRAAQKNCDPPIEPLIRAVSIDGKTVLWVLVAPGTVKHSVTDPRGNTRLYVRVRDKNLLASKQTARRISERPALKLSIKNLDRHELSFLDRLKRLERITLMDFCRSANISKRRALRICIKLEKAGLIRSHDFEREIFYTLNPQGHRPAG